MANRDAMAVPESYDKNADVLSLADQSHVSLRDEHGNVTMEFTCQPPRI